LARRAALAAPLALLAWGRAGGEEALAATGAGAAPRILVVLRTSAPIRAPFVALEDIAEIALPREAAGRALPLRDFVGRVFLGFAPGDGELRRIGREEVRERLRETGLQPGSFQVEGAEETLVHRGEAPPGAAAGSGGEAARHAPAEGEAPPPAREVEAGASVLLRQDLGLVQVEEPCKAMGSADRGGLVEVQVSRTGKRIVARVLAKGVVEPHVSLSTLTPAAGAAEGTSQP
jgi:hypothetical protein